jgi:hypothetical protein
LLHHTKLNLYSLVKGTFPPEHLNGELDDIQVAPIPTSASGRHERLVLGGPLLDEHDQLLLMDLCQKFDTDEIVAYQDKTSGKIYAKAVSCCGEGLNQRLCIDSK